MNENPLGYEKISKLLRSFAVPSITATLVSSLYNIVDQVFIGQGVGYLGKMCIRDRYTVSRVMKMAREEAGIHFELSEQ